MPMLFANAELKRSKVRFGMLTLGAGLLVFVLLFQQALLNALLDGMAGAITHQSAPVLVLAREANRSFSGSLVTDSQLETVAAVPGVADAAELGVTGLSFRRQRDGGASGSGAPGGDPELHNASIIGFRPGRPGTPVGLRRGRLPEAPNEVVASGEDAPGRYAIGDTLTIEPGDTDVVVVGLTEGGRLSVGPTLWVPWTTYEQLIQLVAPDTTVVLPSVVAVEPEPGVTVPRLVRDLNQLNPELEALTREDVAEKAPGRDAIWLGFMMVIALGYVVVAVVIGFFFLTMTVHKESSITTLRAVGARGGYLVRSLLWQVLVVTVGGLVIGSLMLAGAAPLMRSTVLVEVDPADMAVTAVPALAVALLGAVPPLRRVLRTNPADVFSRPSLGGA
jgi:putative ABC transport system permease protein